MQRVLFETMTLQKNKRAEGCIVFPTQHKGEVFFLSHYEVGRDFFLPRNILLTPIKRWQLVVLVSGGLFLLFCEAKAEIFSLNHEGAFRI